VCTNGTISTPSGLTFVTTDSYQTRFESWGNDTSTQIVLIHGAFESAYYFEPLAKILSKNYHVEAYDIKGFGYTQRVAPYTVESDSKQLRDFLLARNLTHPILVGHSLGAGVIARFLLDDSPVARTVRGYIFLDGDGLSASRAGGRFLNYLPNPYVTAAYRLFTRTSIVIPAIFKATCGATCKELTKTELRNIERPFQLPDSQQALLELAQSPIPGVSLSELQRLKNDGAQKEVIFGAQDQEFDPETPAQIASFIGAPSPLVIPNAGHLSMWAQPESVAKAIMNFAGKT
jgi:pimeloyl-ACP methyl ester carboxylesterase